MLKVAQGLPYEAKFDFEVALTHSPDHAAGTVGLSNILLDMFSEKVLPPLAMPVLQGALDEHDNEIAHWSQQAHDESFAGILPSLPLGLGPSIAQRASLVKLKDGGAGAKYDEMPAPYKATRLPLVDRLAARDRAFTLLSGLTRLGTGWDDSDAWFALARAHEECGQPDKAKEVLWWCVELEEAMGVRDWRCVGNGGYII
jgi:hypothetical protein